MAPSLIAAIAGIAFVGYTVQTATGFGSMLVAITLGAHLLTIPELVLLMLPLSVAQCSYIAIRDRGHIDWGLFLRWIIPVMGAGTAVGALVARGLSGDALKQLLAGIILLLSVIELAALAGWLGKSRRAIGPLGTVLGLLGAGLMHGVYAAGGPLLVYTLGRSNIDKSAFRSTITLVWLALNICLITYFAVDGRFNAHHATVIPLLLPAVAVGVVVGDKLHHRLEGPKFRVVLFVTLALAAVSLLLR